MKPFLTIILSCVVSFSCFSQDENKQVIAELNKLSENYKKSDLLSFQVSYYYADEKAPDHVLDSLKGSFKMQGKNFWYDLNETEAMGNDNYTVMLFKEDQIMYLAKPMAAMQTMSPVSLLDSILSTGRGIQGKIENLAKEKKITLTFHGPSKVKQTVYYIDNLTGRLNRMTNIVQSSALYQDEDQSATALNSDAIVEAFFTNYEVRDFSGKLFDTQRYFKKQGDEYIPVSPYQPYKIFLGSVNL